MSDGQTPRTDEPDSPTEDPAEVVDPLSELVTAAEVPDLPRRDAVREHLGGEGGWGRLADLAAWWAAVDPGLGQSTAATDSPADAQRPPARGWADVASAVAAGRADADALAEDGVRLAVLRGVDVPAARALTCVYLGVSPVAVTGWPRERGGRMVPDDEAWAAEVNGLMSRLRTREGLHRSTPPAALLSTVGATEQGWLVAFLLRAAARRLPVVLDGEAALAAAALARWSCPAAVLWWQVADRVAGPAAEQLLGELTLTPLLDLGAERDGLGADLAVRVLHRARDLAVATMAALPHPPTPDGVE